MLGGMSRIRTLIGPGVACLSLPFHGVYCCTHIVVECGRCTFFSADYHSCNSNNESLPKKPIVTSPEKLADAFPFRYRLADRFRTVSRGIRRQGLSRIGAARRAPERCSILPVPGRRGAPDRRSARSMCVCPAPLARGAPGGRAGAPGGSAGAPGGSAGGAPGRGAGGGARRWERMPRAGILAECLTGSGILRNSIADYRILVSNNRIPRLAPISPGAQAATRQKHSGYRGLPDTRTV